MSQLTVHRDLVQGTEAWKAARCGLLTASVVGHLIHARPLGAVEYDCPECLAKPTDPCVSKVKKAGEVGAPIKTLHPGRIGAARDSDTPPVLEVATTDTADSVTLALAAERITRHVEDTGMSSAMFRGVIEEPIARDFYSEHYAPVTEIGFMVRDFGGGVRLGYSPDGLVGDDGLIEVKSRGQKTQVKHVLNGEVPAENYCQLQAGLLVSGRPWIDYVSFSGGMAFWRKRVTPDPAWFAVILAAAERFEANVTDICSRYLAATDGLPMTERTPDFDLEPVI